MKRTRKAAAPAYGLALGLLLGLPLGPASMFACTAASAQHYGIEGSGPMRIPSLEELSRPYQPRVYAPVPPREGGGPLGPFLNDTTLQSGDIVVTPEGPMQYHGNNRAWSHRAGDFAPLGGARGDEINRATRRP